MPGRSRKKKESKRTRDDDVGHMGFGVPMSAELRSNAVAAGGLPAPPAAARLAATPMLDAAANLGSVAFDEETAPAPRSRRRRDKGEPVGGFSAGLEAPAADRGPAALAVLVRLAELVDAEGEGVRALPADEDTKDLACWNWALHGVDPDAADPSPAFTEEATGRGMPFRKDGPMIVPKGRGSAASDRQAAWHEERAKAVIARTWALQEGSPLKIVYQWQKGTAMYQHWELWYEDEGSFVAVAKFPGKPVHAKDTVSELDGSFEQIEVGVDPASMPELHLQKLQLLCDDTKIIDPKPTMDSIYG
jgi:hypothetical protein